MAATRRAVILAGGLGTRLRPLTDAIPKPLLPIGEKSLLEIQMHRLKEFGFEQVFLATNYKSEYIESFFGGGERLGVEVRVSKEEKPLGTCGPLSLLRDELTAPFLVMNGDILTTMDFGALFEFSLASSANLVVTTKKMVMPFAFGNVESDGDFVTGVVEKPDLTIEVIAGIYVMKPAVLRRVPDDTYFGMDDLIKSMLEDHDPVGRFLTRDVWLDVGQLPDYEKAQEVYRTHFEQPSR